MVKEIRKGFWRSFSQHITDFKLFLFLGVFTIVIGITFYLSQKPQEIRQRAFGPGMEFGFAADLSVNGNLQLDQFRTSVDKIAGTNQKWIRLAISPSDIAQEAAPPTPPNTTVTPSISPTPTPPNVVLGATTSPIQWNTVNLSAYDSAIEYALSKGLKIFITTNNPLFAKNYPLASFQSITDEYFRFLSTRYAGKIAIWGVFNNANINSYNDGTTRLSSLDSLYLTNINAVLGVAKNAIKVSDPNTLVTSIAGGNPLTDTLVNNWNQYFDAVNQNVDIISIEMYPNTDSGQINKLSTIVDTLKSKYNKEVVMAGTGICTQNGIYSETDQQNYVPQAINNLKLSSAKLVLQYELVDQNSSSNNCEGSFGIVKSDGTPKASYPAVVTALDITPSPTPTSIPTSTPTPTLIPSETPKPTNHGLLQVTVLPSTIQATINILNDRGKIIVSGTGKISLKSMPPGKYYVAFSYKKTGGLRTPKTTAFKIILNKTTYILGDFSTGKTTVQYQ